MRCRACQAQNDDAAALCFECGAPLAAVVKGTLIASRYEVLRPLGKGGMGMVYLAHDRELDETVALKLLRTDLEDSGDLARRFRSEIRLARRVAHKNVCRIFEYGQDAGRQFIVMAYVEGMDLRRVLQERGPLPPDQAFDIAIRIAEALEAIHEQGIVHRDLKTQNIMLDAKGVVQVMDFGIAKDLAAAPGSEVTVAGGIVGSPDYMSPERWQGHRADVRSDVYALGIVIYELFTGRRPFHADTLQGWAMQHLQAEPALDALPRPLQPVVARALAKDLTERYPSASEMARAIVQARSAPPAPAVARSAPPPLPRPVPSPAPSPRSPSAAPAPAPQPIAFFEPSPTGVPTVAPTVVPTGVGTIHPTSARSAPPAPVFPAGVHVLAPDSGAPPLGFGAGSVALVASVFVGAVLALALAKSQPQAGSPPVSVPPPVRRIEAPGGPRQMAGAAPAPAAPAAAPRTDPAGAQSGTLQVSAVPPAEITVDGIRVTGSLRRIVLAPGTHLVRLETAGYQPIQRAVRIASGEVTSLEIDFAEDGVRRPQ